MLNTFLNQLCHLSQNNQASNGGDDDSSLKKQTELACLVARRLGCFEKVDYTFADLCEAEKSIIGGEHLVEFDERSARVLKITKPEGFGLKPSLKEYSNPQYDKS